MWKKLVTTARYVLYQRCTNCFQRSCTTDVTPGLIDRGQPDGQGGFRRTFQILDHIATYNWLEQTVEFAKAFDNDKA